MTGRAAVCHPDRRYYAKGLCQLCYGRQQMAKFKAAHGLSPQRLRAIALKAQGRCTQCGDLAVTRQYCRACADTATRRWGRVSARKWRAEDPNRGRAHGQVGYAVKTGRLVRPSTCSACGKADRKINADHHDYTKPLEVTWLCYVCHRRVTEERRQAGVAP